ncbi:hypothetical protein A1O1_04586 [Capronia coronata CBS 617.96]|uniref:aldehyde dehydrogenase (NAD(+)) n=1 Tax=Capronia coronata CBS 617.96 TaxID=1182541 RepID=W9Y4B2_9EURO|nr:uncharacterized protein A1O1_04586 [Capronia coronata CBS 617.96]EXJ87662.1 hypothetical protein A1O1_04586 [Capronia coronata CBS 617.96]
MEFPFSASKLPLQMFVNNEYVDVENPRKLTLYNPKDGSLVSDKVPVAGTEDVDLAVKYAQAAFPAWRKVAPAERTKTLLKFADLLEEYYEKLGELTRLTLGSTPAFAQMEASVAAQGLRYNAGWIDKFAGQTYPEADGFLKIIRNEPLGVTAGIVPWNGPLVTIGLKAAPALATGNCFIFKPSEKTPFAALALGPLIKEAGFPPGVFQVLPGDGSTGALLSSHMDIRKISFTGSCATGKKILEMAAKSNLKRVTLELGGKSPAVIFDDCNIPNAVKWTVDAITAGSGQTCFAASRVYVQEGIYQEFMTAYVQAMKDKAKVMGDPEAPGTELGPMVDRAQYERVSGFIQRGQSQGKLLVGGPRVGDKGLFIEPTIFAETDPKSEIHTQEIFGPVSVVRRFSTEEEIMKLSNDTSFGLMAGVFTQDINRAMRIAAEFDSGMVGVNCMSLSFLNAPFGGTKESGIGRECGLSALLAFTETKTVMVNLTY